MRFMTSITLALAALALNAVAAPSNNAVPLADPPKTFQMLKLGVRTRAGCCSVGSCNKLEKNRTVDTWTIHTFRPYLDDGKTPPTQCSTFKFDEKNVTKIENDLNRFWPSFNTSSNTTLWEQEFNTFGCCTLNVTKDLNTTQDYFQKALDLYKEVGLTAKLEAAKIKPNNTTPIKLQTLMEAFKGDPTVEFFCDGQKNKSDILQEVRFCFDRTTARQNCPKANEQTCKTLEIYYLESSSSVGMPSALLVLVVAFVALFTSKN